MQSEIVRLISKYLPLSDKDAQIVTDCIPVKNFKKGAILLREGQISCESYIIFKGLVRKYYLDDGEEKTSEFYTENEAVSSPQSYNKKIPANHYIECIEDCRLAVLTYDKEQELIKKVPGYETLCRVSIEEELGAQQEKLAKFTMSLPEKRYLDLLENRPNLLQRVPQYFLASYLGVKPESLSRIRKRISTK